VKLQLQEPTSQVLLVVVVIDVCYRIFRKRESRFVLCQFNNILYFKHSPKLTKAYLLFYARAFIIFIFCYIKLHANSKLNVVTGQTKREEKAFETNRASLVAAENFLNVCQICRLVA